VLALAFCSQPHPSVNLLAFAYPTSYPPFPNPVNTFYPLLGYFAIYWINKHKIYPILTALKGLATLQGLHQGEGIHVF
jgi:hypothetical protein